MRTVDIDEVMTNLGQLIDAAVDGEPFIITRLGKPAVKVIAVDSLESGTRRRIGFLAGRILVPEDFNCMGSAEIETQFENG